MQSGPKPTLCNFCNEEKYRGHQSILDGKSIFKCDDCQARDDDDKKKKQEEYEKSLAAFTLEARPSAGRIIKNRSLMKKEKGFWPF